MAHLRELPKPACDRCEKVALVRLLNRFNAEQGTFCRQHGKQALAELRRIELADIRRRDELLRF